LTLLVTRVFTNDHDPAVTADNPALVADLLNAWLYLHFSPPATTWWRGNEREALITFTARLLGSLVAVDDAPAAQVIRREFDDNSVLGQDADIVLTHFAADVGQDSMTVGKLYSEHRVREWLDYPALDLDGPVLFRHVLRYLTSGGWFG
jgi:hypothetical protein